MTNNNWREEFKEEFYENARAIKVPEDIIETLYMWFIVQTGELVEQVEANTKREAYEEGKKDAKEIAIELINGNYKGSFIDDADYVCWYADDLIDLITEYLTPPTHEQE